jgi:hypothetical protein
LPYAARGSPRIAKSLNGEIYRNYFKQPSDRIMLSSLPSLAPRDVSLLYSSIARMYAYFDQQSYTLWYTSSYNSNNPSHHVEFNGHAFDHLSANVNPGQNAGPHPHRRPHQQALHRTPLARLRLDEEYIERRKQNVQNYGNSWIKPPGIPKSLYQLREEKREMAEHQEALRREALAQELAEAEAEGADELLQGEGIDGEMEETRDLDDEIPEAEATSLDAEESEAEDLENDVEEVPRGVLASRMPEGVYREALVRGEEVRMIHFGDEGGSMIDEDDQSQMLQEEDLVHETRQGHQDLGMDVDMDADLDEDVPEAAAGGYEHTDTEAELSTSDDDDESVDMGQVPQEHPASASMVRSDGTQNSMDLGSMLSRDESSQVGSSPRQRAGLRGRGG